MPPVGNDQGDIVRDSIIKNKEKTKSYWEQLMIAAAAAEAAAHKPVLRRQNNVFPKNNSNRSSLASIDSATCDEDVVDSVEVHRSSMEEKIALELREMRQRELELENKKNQTIITDDLQECENDSQDGSNCSEFDSDDKITNIDAVETSHFYHRAQSMESVSSGVSSGSSHGVSAAPLRRRNITVRPFSDPEDEIQPSYQRNINETPIEKEIRLVRDREVELRRSQSIQNEEENEKKSCENEEQVTVKPQEPQSPPITTATNRIQKEIMEAKQRESELQNEVKPLKETEEEVIDNWSKIATASHTALNTEVQPRKMQRSTSTTSIASVGMDYLYERNSSIFQKPRFSFANPQRGLMQRFIANKGKMNVAKAPVMTVAPVYIPATAVDLPRDQPLPTRNGFVSAEEKIQTELKEMQQREKELRLQRVHALARSQPNLLALDEDAIETEEQSTGHASLPLYSSNPNLANIEDREIKTTKTLDFSLQKPSKKRFSLLEQWESRIQNSLS